MVTMRRLLSLFGFGDRVSERAAMTERRLIEAAERRRRALANFPFEIVETTGQRALATWEQLKTAGRGVPVVVGKDVENVLGPFDPEYNDSRRPVSETLAAAATIRFPEGLFTMRRDEHMAAVDRLRKMGSPVRVEEDGEPPLGEWPQEPSPELPELSIASDIRTGKFWPKVHIVLVPTDDPTTVPAHLHWGGWNACPWPEYQVAALRYWRDHYGAELVGLEADRMDIRVSRKPATREEALELARVQYAYCNDIVDQGFESYRALAADLMAHDWWFFWWD
jgi:hypothetical protein